MEQSGNSWHQFRASGIGSSDIASILGISPWKSAHQLWKEKTGIEKAVDISNQYQVQRGVINEPRARAMYELISGSEFPPALAIHPKYDFMRVSLDGDNGETVIEIKCPGQKTIDDAKAGKVPDHYMCQIQYQMLCAQRKKGVFFCYHPEQEDYAIVDIKPDLELQSKIEKSVSEFWQKVQAKSWDEETDFVELQDKDFHSAAKNWLTAKKELDEAEKKFEEAKEYVLKFQDKHKKEVRGFGIKILKSEVKGSIDYAKIEILKGLDLEQYRKKSTTRTTIKAISNEGAE
jgi:putative phage-type endonuclease